MNAMWAEVKSKRADILEPLERRRKALRTRHDVGGDGRVRLTTYGKTVRISTDGNLIEFLLPPKPLPPEQLKAFMAELKKTLEEREPSMESERSVLLF